MPGRVLVTLIRHGECEMNLQLGKLVGGRSNESPLTEVGKQQAKKLGQFFAKHSAKWKFDAIYASTAVRARDTAKIFGSEHLPQMPITHSEQLLELDQGEWSGQPRDQCYTPEVLAKIKADNYNFAPPGGESQLDVEVRMKNYIEQNIVASAPLTRDTHVCIVGHGVAIRCFVRYCLDMGMTNNWAHKTENTSITQLELTPDNGWVLHCYNNIPHLY